MMNKPQPRDIVRHKPTGKLYRVEQNNARMTLGDRLISAIVSTQLGTGDCVVHETDMFRQNFEPYSAI